MTGLTLARRDLLVGGAAVLAAAAGAAPTAPTAGTASAAPPDGRGFSTALQQAEPSTLVAFGGESSRTSAPSALARNAVAASSPAPPCPFDGGSSGQRIPPGGRPLRFARRTTAGDGLTVVLTFRPCETSSTTTLVQTGRTSVMLEPVGGAAPGLRVSLRSRDAVVAHSPVLIRSIEAWHLLVLSVGASTASMRILLDGAAVQLAWSGPASAVDPGDSWLIGANFGSPGAGLDVGQFAAYPRELAQDEMRHLWDARQTRYAHTTIRHGVMSNLADYPVGEQGRRAAAIRGLGAQVDRVTVRWGSVQPGPGRWEWDRVDAALQHIADAGQEPIVCIHESAPWAAHEADPRIGADDPTRVPTGAALARWTARYSTFVDRLVRRYAADTGARPSVLKWELWNEPTSNDFWKAGSTGSVSVEDYAAWYTAMHRVVRAASPAAEIAIGSLASVAYAGAGSMAGTDWLSRLIRAGAPVDVVNVHLYCGGGALDPAVHQPFQQNFDDLWTLLDRLRVLAATPGYGHLTRAPVWITEYGWNAAVVGEARQARYLDEALRMLSDYAGSQVALTTHFLALDIEELHYGLYADERTGVRRRRSADVFQRWARQTAGRTLTPSVNRPALRT